LLYAYNYIHMSIQQETKNNERMNESFYSSFSTNRLFVSRLWSLILWNKMIASDENGFACFYDVLSVGTEQLLSVLVTDRTVSSLWQAHARSRCKKNRSSNGDCSQMLLVQLANLPGCMCVMAMWQAYKVRLLLCAERRKSNIIRPATQTTVVIRQR